MLIDPNVLASLPDSTFADGMAEVVKYGYISNREILTMVSQPDYKSNIENIIYECVKICLLYTSIAFGGPVLLVICHSAHSPFLRQSHHPALSKSCLLYTSRCV